MIYWYCLNLDGLCHLVTKKPVTHLVALLNLVISEITFRRVKLVLISLVRLKKLLMLSSKIGVLLLGLLLLELLLRLHVAITSILL